ncbi:MULTISPECIES: hypothetical protein [Pseudomonas]|uniref:hypothetical protein n=1 Tax=Pseudomonas TaxID=286 RepID=UPI0011B06FD3|nr:hypothetical protein [Pseudomonas sp. MYb187]
MSSKINRLSKSLRFGGTSLHPHYSTGEPPVVYGIRRINTQCIELETLSNLNKIGSSLIVGQFIVIAVIDTILMLQVIDNITPEITITILLSASLLPPLGCVFYLLGGNHRTRKVYYIFPGKKHLHILDWDQLEILAGYIPIVSGTINTSRHSLYLIGVDYGQKTPGEVCLRCGNLGVFDGDRSAKSLLTYLQLFMANGPQDIPEPPPSSLV